MRVSKLFSKTQKQAPKDEQSKNAQLLIKAGYIHKEMAGVYDFLPLGYKTLHNIINIIRKHMNSLGALEMQMSALQSKDLWVSTDRWSDEKVDVWFKTSLQNGGELGLAFTHEEPFTNMMKHHVSSYKDLPVLVYQFQRKFRNEVRAKSGIMRTREFIMKDLYSFALNKEQQQSIYEQVSKAYEEIFKELGLGDITYKTFASGGVFSKYSHEFQTVTEVGEDIIYIDKEKNIAVNEEVFTDEVLNDLGLQKQNLVQAKATELGNIFNLGTRFSESLGLFYKDEQGNKVPVEMGSYGIGPARVMGAIVEIFADDKGIVWPAKIAPYQIYLISINQDEQSESLYHTLQTAGYEVLFDDTDHSPGEKLSDADLLGMPVRIVVSGKSIKEGGYEIKLRNSDTQEILDETSLLNKLSDLLESA